MKISPVGAELFHADGQTDRHDEANSRFSKSCECDKKVPGAGFVAFFSLKYYHVTLWLGSISKAILNRILISQLHCYSFF